MNVKSVALAYLGFCAGCIGMLAVDSCATTAGKEARAIATKCGAPVAADVVIEVSRGLDTSEAALEADALKYGVPLVLCVLGELVQPHAPSLVAEARTTREKNAAAFRAAHAVQP